MEQDIASKMADGIEPVARDAVRLVELHADLLRGEIRETASEAVPAVTSLAAGAGLAAAGGLLGSLALVHGLHRVSRVPLWGCYGLVGGLLGAVGAGLMGAGGRKLSGVDFIPRETLATLKEDLEWVRGKTR
ncbi:phage holin family protein [Paludisphaera sp.]|uniref:phage holin family protein n=1 Tax=Paludisphaera sp. TaxID=2017432 RepID=UPI00301D108D